MLAAENHIIVKVDLTQKSEFNINGNLLFTGRNYNENFREKNPVLATVEQGCGEVKTGMTIVTNYSHFEEESPYHLYDNVFSIPVDEQIFASVDDDGSLNAVCGNIIVSRVAKNSLLKMPDDFIKNYYDRGYVAKDGMGYKEGDFIFWLTKSDHEIVYFWNGIEKRVTKIFHKEVIGRLKQ